MKSSRWLEDKKQFKVQKPGAALAKWLNDPDLNPQRLVELLTHAQAVYQWQEDHPGHHGKRPAAFWDSFRKVNQTLGNVSYARQLDTNELAEGNGLDWRLVGENNRMSIPLPELRWLVQLMEEGAILKIRRCKQCTSWFFARFSHQAFCKDQCRIKHLSTSEKFKEKRRKYMREYQRQQTSTNVN